MRIPLSSADITEEEIEAVTAVLRTNTLSLGPKLQEFEEALATYHDIPHAVAVTSGTAALHLAIRALNIGKGDEVIIPSFTFIAVANAVIYERATPVFADIDPITLNLSPASIETLISPRTKAIIVVHTFGLPAPMHELMELAKRHHLRVIEDACEAIGATYNRQLVGTFGDIATFAFYPNKQITTGEGGAILTRDPQLADRMRAMRNQGRFPTRLQNPDWLQHSELGYNYRLSEIACALGVVQLRRLPLILAMRSKVAQAYNDLLSPIFAITRPPLTISAAEISWFVYVIRLAPGIDRDKVLAGLQLQGVGCARYFAPIHLQPAYRDHPCAQTTVLPITELVARHTLALPFFNRLSLADAESVTEALKTAVGHANS